jgi:predicted nucleic acid-binding protein
VTFSTLSKNGRAEVELQILLGWKRLRERTRRVPLPITDRDVLVAKDVMLGTPKLSARDALHIAVMRAHRIQTILTFDRGFDGFPGVKRLGP